MTGAILGSLLLLLLGYLVGVKRQFWLIAGYKPGRVADEERLARVFRTYCFSGALLVMLAAVVLRLV